MASSIQVLVPDIGDFEDVEIVEVLVAKPLSRLKGRRHYFIQRHSLDAFSRSRISLISPARLNRHGGRGFDQSIEPFAEALFGRILGRHVDAKTGVFGSSPNLTKT